MKLSYPIVIGVTLGIMIFISYHFESRHSADGRESELQARLFEMERRIDEVESRDSSRPELVLEK
jgi:hypothetical protein